MQKYFLLYLLFFSVISNFAQSPGGVSNNCVFWVKADDLILNTNEKVSLWNDACGLSNNASQTDISHQPTYNKVVQNYNPGVYFNEIDEQYLNMNNLIDANSTTINIFAVATNEISGNTEFHSVVFGQGENSWISGGYCLCTMNSDQTEFGFWTKKLSNNVNTPWFGGPNMPSGLLEGKYDGTTINFYLDAENQGEFPFSDVIGVGGVGDEGTTHLGGGSLDSHNHKGHISEVVIYSDALSDTDRNKINSYLAIKYGISGINRGGISDNIVSSSGQSVFESLTGDYWNGVIGIGRDDTSALHQKQSHLHSDNIRIYLENLADDNTSNIGNFNNNEFVIMGHNDDVLNPLTIEQNDEVPPPLVSRIEREWKVTNTNFNDTFNVDIKLSDCVDVSQIEVNNLRLLVDDDGDFTNATIYQSGDDGLSIIIEDDYVKILNISNTHIASNSTKYITIASTTPILLNILIANEIDDFFECDTDGDGYEEFTIDVITIENQIIGAQTEIDTVEFFDENGDPLTLPNPYINETQYTQTITVRVTHNLGCYIETTFDLVTLLTPILDTQVNLIECSGFVLPEITGTDLSGNQAYYTETGGGGTSYLGTHIDDNGIQVEGDILSFNDFTSYPVTLYIADGIVDASCYDEISFQLTLRPSPEVNELRDVEQCGAYTLPTIPGTNLSGNQAYYTEPDGLGTRYLEGDELNFINFANYPVTLYAYDSIGTGANFCFDETNFEIILYNSVDFELLETNLDINDIGTIVINMDDNSVNYEYAVDNFNYQTTNVFTDLEEGMHTLFVRDENGCIIKRIDFEIILIYSVIPIFFTPNADGVNDYWGVIDNLNVMKNIYIFDRYGKVVASILPNTDGWDGNYNGKQLFTTDYWYLIEFNTGEQLRGHFSLVR